MEAYNYTGSLLSHVRYCSDRMNQGRAKALIRLWEEDLGMLNAQE
jgi:hypothetical protein